MLDISVPATPVLLGGVSNVKTISALQVAGGWASVLTNGAWQLVDLRNPAAAVWHGRYPVVAYAEDIQIAGSRAYIAAEYGGGLQIVDIADPHNPIQLGSYADITASGLDVKNNLAYVTDPVSNGGLHIIDISTLTNTVQLGRYDNWYREWDVQVVGSLAYVAAEKDGLQIVDISDPANPVLRGANTSPENSAYLQVEGHLAYVLDNRNLGNGPNVLYIMDVSDPTNPVVLGTYQDARMDVGTGMRVADGLAYIATGQSLQIIDVSDPAHPVWRGSYDVPIWAVQVVGKRAYVATESGLAILDVSDPAHPSVLGAYTGLAWRGSEIEVVGDLVYVAAGWSGVHILHVTYPATPTSTPTFTSTPTTTGTPEPTSTPTHEPDLVAQLTIDYQTGMPGSAFIITGSNYQPNASIQISVNDVVVGTLTVGGDGTFTLVLTTVATAEPGAYRVTARTAQVLASRGGALGQAGTEYTLDRAAPLREPPKHASTIVVSDDVPPVAGSRAFLPLIAR